MRIGVAQDLLDCGPALIDPPMSVRPSILRQGGDPERTARCFNLNHFLQLASTMQERVDLLIGIELVVTMTSLSRSAVYARINRGDPAFDATFPRPIKLGFRSAWSFWEVQGWIREQLQSSRRVAQDVRS